MVNKNIREVAKDIAESLKSVDESVREFVFSRVKSLVYKDGEVYYKKYGVFLNLSDLNLYSKDGKLINNSNRLKEMVLESLEQEHKEWLVEEEKIAEEILRKVN